MNNDFSTLKKQVDLADYITRQTGTTTNKLGTDTLNLSSCPFCGGHDCFRITPEKQSYHCFQCTEEHHGDIYDFIQRHNGCDKTEALRILAKDQGYTLHQQKRSAKSPAKQKAEDDHTAIFEEAASYYHKALKEDSRALNYQRRMRRHLSDTLETFRVGYADGGLYHHLKGKGYSDDQLVASGLVKLKNGQLRDFFLRDLYIYPHLDKEKQVAGFTIKDQRGKYNYRLPREYWRPDSQFYNMPAFKGEEIILVEGENDLLSVYGRGEMKNVIAINGQISAEQLDFIRNWAPGKKIYLCFDNDTGGQQYTEKVCQRLRRLCLPDTMGKLFNDSYEPPTELRIIHFTPETKDIDEYLAKQQDPKAALQALLKGAERYFPPLPVLKELYSAWVRDPENERKFDFDTFGKICFEWFQANGKFFIDGEECFLYFKNWIYRIGGNTPFKALLYNQAGINAATNGAKLIVQNIESQAYLRGDHTSVPGWIFTNLKDNVVYFNLCGEFNTLLKIGPGKIETVANGTNAEKVLLRNSPKMHPLCFYQDVDIKKGMAALKEYLFDNLACDLADRYFILCLVFNVVLLQYVKARGITKFSGTKGCGKTSAASMFSALVYGQDCVTTGSAASDFSEAAVSPLTISDNLETDAVKGGKREFLLTAATGITRQKRKSGSDSDNVYERSCTQVLVTSIEPFAEPELIERTNEILFDKKYHNPGFKESVAVEADLHQARDLIWSAIFKITAYNILPDIEKKKADALKMIREQYPNHSKSRLNELYAMLYLILGEVTKYISQPGYENDPEEARWIFNAWIVDQNNRSFETQAETNNVLYRLEALVKEYLLRPDGFEEEYGITVQPALEGKEIRELAFFASTRGLHMAFEWLNKDRGLPNPFRSPSQLGSRISDSIEVLEKGNWTMKRNAKIIRGERLHLFNKLF